MCVAFCSPLRNMETSKQKEERAMNAKSAKDKKRKSPKAFRRTSLKSLGNFINKVLKTLGTLSQVGNVEQPDTEEDDGGFGDGAARALSAGSGKCKPDGRDDFKKSGTVSTQGPVRDRLSWPCGDKTPGVQGLKNHGNTCFMNAVIQCLSNTDLLAEHLGLEQYKAEQRRAHGLRQEGLQPAKGEVTERLASLVRALWTLEYTPQLSVDFKSVVSKYGSQFRGNSQHDALEFLLWLLDRVHEDANPSSTVSNGNNPSSTVSNSSNPSSTVSNGNNPSSTVTNGTSSSSRVTLYDYQAICRTYAERSDSSNSLLDPYFALFATAKWLLTELIILLVEFNLYSWWQSDFTAKAEKLFPTMLVPCDIEYPAFISERTIKETTGNIDCEDCTKSFVIQQIPSSNLFMVVVDNKCSCVNFKPVTMDPIEIMYNESLKCERLKLQKDRRRPDTCHPFHPEENSMECGRALDLTPSLMAVFFALLTALFPR